MGNIALPKKITYQPSDIENRGDIIIEPCFPGYGITLSNALRRVLLSSLEGAAPVGIVIEGANHEFMAVPHLKEDILEFILNIKQLRIKMFTDEPVVLNLEVHGKKTIKASDIEKNPLVEIANPDLELGTITDMAGKLKAQIYVEKGMGYVSIESREKKSTIVNFIEMDSIFTPVISVGIRIENVRVGKMTNWEKIILDIKTDGTITPQSAFDEAVGILISQFSALNPNYKEKEKEEEIESKIEPEEKQEEKAEEEIVEKKKRGRPKNS